MEPLATQIIEHELVSGRLFIAPTKTRDVVSITGSIYGGELMLPKQKSQAVYLASRLLDAGTTLHPKDTLRELLAARGANLSFSVGNNRLYFGASCLPEDLSFIFELLVECLSKSVFANKELETVKARMLGQLIESKTDTASQAHGALTRLLFDPSNVNYDETVEESIKRTRAVTRADVLSYKPILGKGGLIVAVTGDIESRKVVSAAHKAFSKLPLGTDSAVEKPMNLKKLSVQEKLIQIKDKANIDVYLGTALPILYTSSEYQPLKIAVGMLGGGFAAHLMQTVRERDGLTYGIGSSLGGFGEGFDGYFQVKATFSPAIYQQGLDVTRKEINNFFKKNITADVLQQRKDELVGEYVIALSTTYGLARKLHSIGVRGQELSYIDTYLDQVKSISLEKVKNAAKLIQLDKLSLAAAGTFEK